MKMLRLLLLSVFFCSPVAQAKKIISPMSASPFCDAILFPRITLEGIQFDVLVGYVVTVHSPELKHPLKGARFEPDQLERCLAVQSRLYDEIADARRTARYIEVDDLFGLAIRKRSHLENVIYAGFAEASCEDITAPQLTFDGIRQERIGYQILLRSPELSKPLKGARFKSVAANARQACMEEQQKLQAVIDTARALGPAAEIEATSSFGAIRITRL